MNLMFWKKKPVTEEGAEQPVEEAAIDKTPSSSAEAADEQEAESSDATHVRAARTKKRMLVFGGVGVLVLVLSGVAVVVWKLFFSPPPAAVLIETQKNTVMLPSPHKAKTLIKLPDIEVSKTQAEQVELKTLKKKNAELEAELNALKQQESRQLPSATLPVPAVPAQSAVGSGASGTLVIDSAHPKETAMSLKAAIEAMNAGTGDYAKAPAKKSAH